MTREDAIKKVRQMSLPKETMEILEALAPELAESEDERIRKEIISFIEYEEASGNIPDGWHQAKRPSEWIAWLEKYKEPKPIYEDEYQKMLADSYNCGKDEVISNPEKYGLQKPAEWGEEDEKSYKEIIHYFESLSCCLATEERHAENRRWLSFLKSLRSSGKPSEVCYGAKGDPDPAGVWKPSEEQMNALNFAITYFMHETSYKNPTELRDLYEDLLKLKGGVATVRDIDE